MREIKFRVFEPIMKKMWSWEEMQNGCFSLFNRNPRDIWMQFIGLTDKQSKEIYEGDIVMVWELSDEEKQYAEIGEIIWQRAGWLIGNVWRNPDDIERKYLQVEVIGNIYKNPELLT